MDTNFLIVAIYKMVCVSIMINYNMIICTFENFMLCSNKGTLVNVHTFFVHLQVCKAVCL